MVMRACAVPPEHKLGNARRKLHQRQQPAAVAPIATAKIESGRAGGTEPRS
jgi:hypothetical protein